MLFYFLAGLQKILDFSFYPLQENLLIKFFMFVFIESNPFTKYPNIKIYWNQTIMETKTKNTAECGYNMDFEFKKWNN